MKKTERIVVWTSVKMSKISFIGFLILFSISTIGAKKNNFSIKICFCVFIALAMTMYLNSRGDEVYKKLWPENTQEKNSLLNIRVQSLWIAFFLASLLLFFIK